MEREEEEENKRNKLFSYSIGEEKPKGQSSLVPSLFFQNPLQQIQVILQCPARA